MIKLKEIIKESKFAFDRKFGEPLPTFKGVMEKHQTLIEKRELGGARIHQIEMATDKNNHTEARLVLARAVGDKKLVQAYEGIDAVHIYLRDMGGLTQARDRLDKKLFAQAKKVFSDYSIIMSAF